MTHDELTKAYCRAVAHKILPCHFCAVPAIVENCFCLGCGLIICIECQVAREMPCGVEHPREAHTLVPEDEIKTCWACGARMKRPDPEADLCHKCESRKMGGSFGSESIGGTA